jgi:alpha,alpha-trehalose phosphorylase
VGAKGLSGEGYEGHYFWDTEIYVFPFFLMTNRDIAKGLLEYRYNILEKAREHARLMGHPKGALYAWRTITGSECSGYYPSAPRCWWKPPGCGWTRGTRKKASSALTR